MATNETVIRFEDVFFEYLPLKPILTDVSFSVRKGSKITIMGQNGAGKSTIFKMITGDLVPKKGKIHIDKDMTIATAFQVMQQEDKDLTIQAFFNKYYKDKTAYNIDKKIAEILEVVNLYAPLDRIVKSFSGGQQARLLLAAALIQNPDILLLDEPTNNLDKDGIYHLEDFIKEYKKTVIVISHDAEFLNSFTDGVLYLDVFTKVVEQYVGNYYNVVDQIKARIERENMKNSQMIKQAQAKKEQAGVFAHKGGKLRLVAKKMREAAEELEEEMVDVRKEDKTIRAFTIPVQEDLSGEILKIDAVSVIIDHEPIVKKADISLRKGNHLLLSGPNGIGKSTLLESIANERAIGSKVSPGVKIGYYRQDFSNLDFNATVYDQLRAQAGPNMTEQELRSTAAGFLITGDVMKSRVGDISEGQKGLVAFCGLVLMQPGLLILDEPTNHINFRHIPVIAEALDEFQGAMILVSHVDEFMWQISIDTYLELDCLK
ncbi:MAG: ATP-binding cassette domain-containing protein [Candidatus Gracilibacteria bacterium]|nr:ATP-binding cassette domain-containing protein [Candidatus Gracilibacteria bacterium]MDD3119990.1 ATP-binding cassette domain-containing protein [Candidatus Gracilibacteria bacterium]MDD4529986.1 ATP-binding cassette domain-containing protein [Candidatus Gracilibacteria bacterium]